MARGNTGRIAVGWLGGYLVAVGIVVAVPTHTPGWLRTVGVLVAIAGAVQLARLAAPGRRRRGSPARHDGAALRLADRAPELAAYVEESLALLDGPLGALVDRGAADDTRAAFATTIDQADRAYSEEADARRTLSKLTYTLQEAKIKPRSDTQYRAAVGQVDAATRRRKHIEAQLKEAADDLHAGIRRAASARQERETRGELDALRASVAGRVRLGDSEQQALGELDDAVSGVRARLDAVGELDALTDRVAPDAAAEQARDA